jgi:hypothetical protein
MAWKCAECDKTHTTKTAAWECCSHVETVVLFQCFHCGEELESGNALCSCLEPSELIDHEPDPNYIPPGAGQIFFDDLMEANR